MRTRYLNCACCYQLEIAELRWDRYGRPYVLCGACGARTWTRTPNALRGIYMTSRMVEAVRRQVESDPIECERREREAEAFVQEIRAEREALVEAGRSGRPDVNGVATNREGGEHVQAVPVAVTGK
jgi:transcription elongation factor Elf1